MANFSDIDVSKPENVPSNEQFAEAREERDNIPDGYITINLSTAGRLYAPAKFHIKNLTAEDLLGMVLTDDQELPIKVLDIFNGLVYENNVDLGKFHEDEVIETLFEIYKTFYSSKITVPYKLQDADYKYLQSMHGGPDSDEYLKLMRDLDTKRWEPKVEIDLNSVKKYTLPENFQPVAKVTKRSGFTCKYGLPKYGDVRDLKDFIEIIYRQLDDKYSSMTNTLRYRQEMLDRREKGENILYESIPNLTRSQEKEYQKYSLDRNLMVMKAIRAIHILEYRGKDVADLPIEKKLTLAEDPEFDLPTYTAISKKFDELKIGLSKTVKVISPVTNMEVADYPFSFRVFDLLQAIQTSGSDGITVEFE